MWRAASPVSEAGFFSWLRWGEGPAFPKSWGLLMTDLLGSYEESGTQGHRRMNL